MWTRSLCGPCNSMAGGQYDTHYGDFTAAVTSKLLATVHGFAKSVDFHGIPVPPARVVRSVLCCMYALNTQLKVVAPETAEDLRTGAPEIRWNPDLRLRLALNFSTSLQVEGGMCRIRLVEPKALRNPFSEIWFNPLAWALVPAAPPPRELGSSYFDTPQWVDVTSWINLDRALPAVVDSALASAPRLTSFWPPGDNPNLWGLMYYQPASTMISGHPAPTP